MTNIQAINLLKGLEQSLDDYCELNDEGKTAFRMAITALEVFGNSEQLPSVQPEPCEDAVSREAVSKWLKQYGQDVLHGKYKFSLMYIWKNLMALPSAQPVARDINVLGNDLIIRQEAIETSLEFFVEFLGGAFHENSQKELIARFQRLPSTQPEIIRCRDCKHHDGIRCFRWNSTIITGFDDFCSNAERREEGEQK